MNHQGGKSLRSEKEKSFRDQHKQYLDDDDFVAENPDLEERLDTYMKWFIEVDKDYSGRIAYSYTLVTLDFMELKLMLEKIGQPKTHLECKAMIKEVAKDLNAITYQDFLEMMLGKKNSILKIILKFEEMKKGEEKRKGPPPKKTLDSLP